MYFVSLSCLKPSRSSAEGGSLESVMSTSVSSSSASTKKKLVDISPRSNWTEGSLRFGFWPKNDSSGRAGECKTSRRRIEDLSFMDENEGVRDHCNGSFHFSSVHVYRPSQIPHPLLSPSCNLSLVNLTPLGSDQWSAGVERKVTAAPLLDSIFCFGSKNSIAVILADNSKKFGPVRVYMFTHKMLLWCQSCKRCWGDDDSCVKMRARFRAWNVINPLVQFFRILQVVRIDLGLTVYLHTWYMFALCVFGTMFEPLRL